MSQNPDGKKFPWQGRGSSGSQPTIIDRTTRESASAGGGGGSVGTRSAAPPPTQDQTVAGMRAQSAFDRNMARFNELVGGRQFRSAAQTQERAERARDLALDQQAARDFMQDMYGASNTGEAFQRFREEMRDRGGGLESMFGISQKDFENWVKEQTRSAKDRREEEQSSRSGASGQRGADKDQQADNSILTKIAEHVSNIDEKLPLNALGGGE
jgi:hypothetical protein